MKQPTVRLLKTTARLPSSILTTTERFQVWLLIGDRSIEVGPLTTSHEDAQAIVTLMQRAFPGLDYEEWTDS